MNKVKITLEVDGVLVSQANQNLESEKFVKDLKEITDSPNIEVEKAKELIKNFLDRNY
jgi:hypothetical protein